MENSLDRCMMYVYGYLCRIGAETSLCRIAVLEVSVKTVVPLLRMEHFSEINNWRSDLFLTVELIELLGS